MILSYAITDNLQVKNELAINFKHIISYLNEDSILSLLNIFIKDNSEVVRMNIMDAIVNLIDSNIYLKLQDFLIKIIEQIATDEIWRIRFSILNTVDKFLISKNTSSPLRILVIEVFTRFIDDNENDIRNTVCLKLVEVVKVLGNSNDSLDLLLKNLKKLEKDSAGFVKGICSILKY